MEISSDSCIQLGGKNENLATKEADISILFVSVTLSLILWQEAAATARIHLKIFFHPKYRACIVFSRLVFEFKQLSVFVD